MTDFPANFAKVDDLVWRGARPDVAQAKVLYVNGVRTAINLEWEQNDDRLWPPYQVRCLRVSDFEPLPFFAPRVSDLHVIRALTDITRFGKPVSYVHCRSGKNRTGVVVAAYRLVVLDQPLNDVLADFNSYRGWWAFADERYIKSIAERREWFKSRIS